MKDSISAEEKPRLGEELANAITHGVGAILAIAGFAFLMIVAEGYLAFSLAVYGTTLVLLYLASTLYHSLVFTRARRLFRKFDHMAIFLLIAGTYTPFCLTVLEGWWGWAMLIAVWVFAIIGIILKSLFTGRFEWISVSMYILTGWMVILAIKPIYEFLSAESFILLVCGGLCYTIGTVFYVKSRIPYFHSIWHLWVLAGSVTHFFCILSLV